MPAQRPRASFEPIAPDFDVTQLVESTENFQFVDRISCDMIDANGLEQFEKLVLVHVVIGGKPLVIDGYQSRLDPWTFSPRWLKDNHGAKVENTRDLIGQEAIPMTIGHYLKNMNALGEQYFEKRDNHKDLKRQRLYLKDIDCPSVWQDKLRDLLPPNLFYLNEGTGEVGGPGSVKEKLTGGNTKQGRGIAGSGDLMSSLPEPMRAENLMCYVGHEGTFTPAHREMCASLGNNIMVEASNVMGDDGRPERPGSSIWFMTESKDRHSVAEYWLSLLGHDIEVEKHFAQVAAWQSAPFTTYVVEQRPGDFILIPPLAPHQVWNRGTRTMKVAWNRTTVETLDMAMKEALPRARMVCRDEQYKNKAIIFYTLNKYSALLAKTKDQQQTAPSPQEAAALRSSPRIRQLQRDFKRLLQLFRDLLLSEMFAPDTQERGVQFLPFDGNVTCAYCRGNIFNRFLTCPTCDNALGTSEPEPYDVCMDCYAMGRSCGCISKLKWVEQWKWKELTSRYETWRKQYTELETRPKSDTPLPLNEERVKFTKKTLAQICQQQLKKRPFHDISNVPSESEGDETNEDEQITIENGTVKKARKKKRRSEAWLKNRKACHVCCHRHEKWRMAECECGRAFCYGTLFRGMDLLPSQIMAEPEWKCPHCEGICFAGNCRKDPRQKPYQPKSTLLGHDTRKVADVRSVESLVDFRVSNLNFLGESVKAPPTGARLEQRQAEANQAKQQDDSLNHHYTGDDDDDDVQNGAEDDPRNRIRYSPVDDSLDPALFEEGDGTSNDVIDPSLRPQSSTPPPVTLTSHQGSVPVASLMNNAPHNQPYDGHRTATQSGYVAPTAVMFSPNDAEGDHDGSEVEYPALDNPNLDGSADASNKRKRMNDSTPNIIRRMPIKKRRKTDDPTQTEETGASKQFRKERERKAMEEARKKGRYMLVSAAIRGKTKLVKLSIGRANAQSIRAQHENGGIDSIVVRSDVAPAQQPNNAPVRTGKNGASNQSKIPDKSVRVPVERDEDYDSRHRGRKSKKTTRIWENIDLDSDEGGTDDEENAAETAGNLDGAVERTSTGRKVRRTSAWQTKRAQEVGDGDVDGEFEELPPDFKDSRNHNRNSLASVKNAANSPSRNGARQAVAGKSPRFSSDGRKPAGKSVPQIRPTSNLAYEISSNDDDSNEDDNTNANLQVRNVSRGAVDKDSENRMAKLAAAGYEALEAMPQSDMPVRSWNAINGQHKGNTSTSALAGGSQGSILDRAKGPGGKKKIKIVGKGKKTAVA